MNAYIKEHIQTQNKYALFTFATIPPAIVAMTVCNSLWTIKANQIVHGISKFSYSYFYKGLAYGYLNNLNGVITFTLYDIMKEYGNHYTLYALVAKTIATVICFPIFTLRIRTQVGSTTHTHLFKGLMCTLAQQLPKTTLMLTILEFLNKQ